MFKFIVILSIIVVINCFPKSSRDSCTVNNQCDIENECCQKPILSFFPNFEVSNIGSCKRYLEEGADCSFMAFNSCGCKPGLICTEIPWFINLNITWPIVIIKFFYWRNKVLDQLEGTLGTIF